MDDLIVISTSVWTLNKDLALTYLHLQFGHYAIYISTKLSSVSAAHLMSIPAHVYTLS